MLFLIFDEGISPLHFFFFNLKLVDSCFIAGMAEWHLYHRKVKADNLMIVCKSVSYI